jgi:hypothetical protein
MATKLKNDAGVERELSVTLNDNDGTERPVVAELRSDGTVALRLRGMRRTVTIDLLAALAHSSGDEDCDHAIVSTEQQMTAAKRTLAEHLSGK